MVQETPSPRRGLLHRLRAAFTGEERTQAQFRELARRLDRIERQLEGVHKIWLRTRHLEPAIQAVLRERYVDPASLPYPERLLTQRFRLASQNQEDGITIALLREAGIATRTFLEIGSGLSGGNSAFLAREWGWKGLMIDGAGDTRMTQVGRRFPNVTSVHAWVTRENVNELITASGFAGEVDLFSLDLDGVDFWIWEAMTACTPRIVVLEYNSMFGPDRSVTVPYEPAFDRHQRHGLYYGVSLTAWTRLAARKGYRLVAVEPAGINAFFVRHDVAPAIPACDPRHAYRIQERHDVAMAAGEDLFAIAGREGWPLVEIA